MASPAKLDRPTYFRYVVLGLACQTSLLLYMHRYMFSLVMPELKKEFNLGETQLGLLNSAFSLFYGGCQVPAGIAVDMFGVHLTLTLMIVVWSVGLGMHAWAPNANGLWFARVTLATGQAGCFAALSRTTRSWFPLTIRTTVQGLVGVFCGRAGGMLTNLLIGSVVLGMLGVPWRTAIYVLTVIGLIHALLLGVLFRNSPSRHPAVNDAEAELIAGGPKEVSAEETPKMTFGEMFGQLSPRSLANLFALNIQSILSNVADNIFAVWIPTFLADEHGLQFREMGFFASLPLLGGALGGLMGGWLNDVMIRATGSLRWSRTCVGLAGKGIAGAILLTALLWYDQPYVFCSILFFVKFFSDWSLSTSWGTVTDIGGRSPATVFAFNNAVGTVGAIAAPLIYGYVAEHDSWLSVFQIGAAAYILCALSWLVIDSRIPIIKDSLEADK